MLSPDERAVLLDALRPPAGAVLDAGVATTFTLEFAAALVPPLAFAAVEVSRSDDPVAALQAVRQCSDRLDLFHQAGQIAVPARASRLVAYLETMVHAVRRPSAGYLFHPKVWFLRYRDTESDATSFRLLCLTRNLTQDRSWDAIVQLDGMRQGRPRAANRPIADLIRSLPRLAVEPLPGERIARINSLAEDARHIEWEFPPGVEDLVFHHLAGRTTARPDFSGSRHLVVSPFLTDDGLGIVAPGSSSVTVISRTESFDALSPETAAAVDQRIMLSMLAVDDEAETAPVEGGPGVPGPVPFGLHAKVIIVEKGRQARVIVGSANATGPAWTGNIEFVVELVGPRTTLGIDAFLHADTGLGPYLESYAGEGGLPPNPDDEARRRLDRALRDLAERAWAIQVHPVVAQAAFRLAASTDRSLALPPGYRGTVELLTNPGLARPLTRAAPVAVEFDGVVLEDVTPFLALRLEDPSGLTGGTVVRATLVGDPPGRLDRVLASQVNTPEKFLRFLALLLGLDPVGGGGIYPDAGTGGAGFGRFGPGGVLEAVLRALADSPAVILDLDRLVSGLARTPEGRKVMPAGFPELWTTVMAAQRIVAEAGVRT